MSEDKREAREVARQARGFKRDIGHVYLLLIGAAILLMVLSPVFNRYLGTWQAVVVAPPDDGEVEIMLHDSMVDSLSIPDDLAEDLEVGDYLLKKRFTWNPLEISEDELHDLPTIEDPRNQPPVFLPAYFERYMSEWAGTVSRVEVRKLPTTGAGMDERREESTMTIALDDGGTRTVPVPEELEGRIRVGVRLEKSARSWMPQVTGMARDGR